jgi:glycosyltransferase involved in cell wall biosynthesis
LARYNGLNAQVVRHPSTLRGLSPGPDFDYLFLPGRLHRWKRVELAIKAMRSVKAPIPLLISGTGDEELRLRDLAARDPRIRFLGHVDDAQLAHLYRGALAVVFAPLREDLGLVTLEAFQSGKPVITCADSGEPARLVRDGFNGFVCSPDPVALAQRIDQLAADRHLAVKLGARGEDSVGGITWSGVASTLAQALGFGDLIVDGKAAP